MTARRDFGSAGHFICGRRCCFHLCTQVGPWLVSTVGEYEPDKEGAIETVGLGRLYETMVFLAGEPCEADECGACGVPRIDGCEVDFAGYNRAGDAQRGHEAMVEKWKTMPVLRDR